MGKDATSFDPRSLLVIAAIFLLLVVLDKDRRGKVMAFARSVDEFVARRFRVRSAPKAQDSLVGSSTRRLMLVSASAGAGFAIFALLGVGAWVWYNALPKTTITAEFVKMEKHEGISFHDGTTNPEYVTLEYRLHNHTRESLVFGRLLVAVRSEGTLTPVLYDTNDEKQTDGMATLVPLILPAGEDVLFVLEWPRINSSIESLVVFDEGARHRIDLPKGW